MAGMIDVTITAKDSPIPNVLDWYYTFLKDLLNPTADQRIALNSTLVTFDILSDSSLYNEYVYRAFADRTIATSPTNAKPVALGPANFANRYSYSMVELLRRVIRDIDSVLTPGDLDKIKNLERDVEATRQQLFNEYQDMEQRWAQHKKDEGISDDDPYILDKQTAYFNTFNFAERIRQLKNQISDSILDIDTIRDNAYPDDDARQLVLLMRYATLDQYLMTRPTTPKLEHEYKYDEARIAQMWIYGNLNYFETSIDLLPSGFLEQFVTNVGERSYLIKKKTDATYSHDKDWHVSASAGWDFFSASVDASYSEHVRESISKINSVEIGFKNIAEYWVRRGMWYSNTIFDMKRVTDKLQKYPTLAANLSQIISSVVIGRGMWIKYYFDSKDDYKYWENISVSGSAGYNFLGMETAQLGGSYSESTIRTFTNEVEKSVTFADSDDHCRLVGFRVDNLLGEATQPLLDFETGRWSERTDVPAIGGYLAGKISYNDLRDARAKALSDAFAKYRKKRNLANPKSLI